MGGGCVFLVGGASSFTVRILSVLIAKDMANLRVRVQVTGLSWAGWRRDTYPVPTRLGRYSACLRVLCLCEVLCFLADRLPSHSPSLGREPSPRVRRPSFATRGHPAEPRRRVHLFHCETPRYLRRLGASAHRAAASAIVYGLAGELALLHRHAGHQKAAVTALCSGELLHVECTQKHEHTPQPRFLMPTLSTHCHRLVTEHVLR